MKFYQFLFLLAFCAISCSEDSSLGEIDHDELKIETRKAVRNCYPSDIPCGVNTLEDLVGVIDFNSTDNRSGLGSNGALDNALNCRVGISSGCFRKCFETVDLSDLLPAIDFTGCETAVDVLFSAEDQFAIIEAIESTALILPPTCDGVPMIPLSYDVYMNILNCCISVSAVVTYGSECAEIEVPTAG